MPRLLLMLALLLTLPLSACDTESSSEPSAEAPSVVDSGPPPWETGFEREWFYPAHLTLPGNQKRWAGLASAVGRQAPELELQSWRFGKRQLSELRGKVVLLDFWATWCADCLKAIPHANELREELADEAFELIGICAPKDSDNYAATIAATGLSYPTGLDRDGRMERAYEVPRWPYYVLLDTQGVIRAAGLHPDHLEPAVRHLIAEERERGAL